MSNFPAHLFSSFLRLRSAAIAAMRSNDGSAEARWGLVWQEFAILEEADRSEMAQAVARRIRAEIEVIFAIYQAENEIIAAADEEKLTQAFVKRGALIDQLSAMSPLGPARRPGAETSAMSPV